MKNKILKISLAVFVIFTMTLNFLPNTKKTFSNNKTISLIDEAQAANKCTELYLGVYVCCKIAPGDCNAGYGAVWEGPYYW